MLTPQQKVKKFMLNDCTSESWDKGFPAECGSKGLQAVFTQALDPTFWEKLRVGCVRKNSICSA